MKTNTLKDLFDKKILRIPDYQRGYSWEAEQLEDLWNDLSNINLAAYNSFHFTGIITLSKPSEENKKKLIEEEFLIEDSSNKINLSGKEYEAYNVVDGQQRLVTLLILISLLAGYIPNDEKNSFWGQYISVKQNGTIYYLFGYEKDIPSHQYLIGKIFDDDTMQVTEPETVYTMNLKQTKQFFNSKLEKLDSKEKHDLLKKVHERLLFYIFEIDENLDMSLVFETLNYRGKPLSKLELFKNRLIYLVTKKYENEQQEIIRTQIVSTWQDIYEWLGKNEKSKLSDDEFLRAFWILYFKHDKDKDDDFKKYEEDLFNNKFSIKDIKNNQSLNFRELTEELLPSLSKAIKYWFFINNPYFENKCELLNYPNKTKEILLQINNSYIAAYTKILCLAILFRNNDSDDREGTNKLLEAIERHNFCTYLFVGKQADTNRPQIYRLINQFFSGNISNVELQLKISDFTTKHINFDDINDNIHKSRQKNEKFYDWEGIKYLLWNYEACLQRKPANEIEAYSKYHVDLIFPDERGFGVQYPGVTRNHRSGANLNTLKYSLGNITITTRKNNPQSFNKLKPFLEKGSANDKEIAGFDDWTDEIILQRGLKILDFIENRWGILIGTPKEKKKLLVEDLLPNYNNANDKNEDSDIKVYPRLQS